MENPLYHERRDSGERLSEYTDYSDEDDENYHSMADNGDATDVGLTTGRHRGLRPLRSESRDSNFSDDSESSAFFKKFVRESGCSIYLSSISMCHSAPLVLQVLYVNLSCYSLYISAYQSAPLVLYVCLTESLTPVRPFTITQLHY